MTLLTSTALAAETTGIPHQFNLQSLIFDSDGNLSKDSKADISIRILDENNNVIFTEEHGSIPLVDGAVNLNIGETNAISLDALNPATGMKFLDILVNGATPFDLMPITAEPYSLWAERALSVPDESIASQQIKNGSIKAEDLDAEIGFGNLSGSIAVTQIPNDIARAKDLEDHKQSTTAHDAANITVNVPFTTFVARNVLEGLQKIDIILKNEVYDRQLGQGETASSLKAVQDSIDTHKAAASVHGSDGNVVGQNTLNVAIEAEAKARGDADTEEVKLRGDADTAEAKARGDADTLHAGQTGGVHGIGANSTIVGTKEIQTLENKTLISPTITGATIAGDLANDTVQTADLQDGAVNSAKILDESITAGDLGTDSVNTDEIASNAVTADEIASGAVGTDEILDGSIRTGDLFLDETDATSLNNMYVNEIGDTMSGELFIPVPADTKLPANPVGVGATLDDHETRIQDLSGATGDVYIGKINEAQVTSKINVERIAGIVAFGTATANQIPQNVTVTNSYYLNSVGTVEGTCLNGSAGFVGRVSFTNPLADNAYVVLLTPADSYMPSGNLPGAPAIISQTATYFEYCYYRNHPVSVMIMHP